MWPIQLSFLLFIVCSTFLSSVILCNTPSSLTRAVQPILWWRSSGTAHKLHTGSTVFDFWVSDGINWLFKYD
jgi:hypothetical protein